MRRVRKGVCAEDATSETWTSTHENGHVDSGKRCRLGTTLTSTRACRLEVGFGICWNKFSWFQGLALKTGWWLNQRVSLEVLFRGTWKCSVHSSILPLKSYKAMVIQLCVRKQKHPVREVFIPGIFDTSTGQLDESFQFHGTDHHCLWLRWPSEGQFQDFLKYRSLHEHQWIDLHDENLVIVHSHAYTFSNVWEQILF